MSSNITAMDNIPTLEHIRAAHERIRPFIHRTPVMSSELINALPIEVPMEIDIGTGQNWLEAH